MKASLPGSVLVNAKDIQAMFNISSRTVWLWTDLGKLPEPIRFSSQSIRWRRADIEALLEQRAQRKAKRK
jgi:predicted DNA-binding transcriptional regulator AlpA